MNDTSQDAWFFTQEGEKIGPVTFSDLRAKAAEGGLRPRLDMVWCQGMAEWKPAGEVEGLFERKAPEVRESLAPPADPYRPPEVESVADTMLRQIEWPGARRRSYLPVILIFPFVWQWALTFILPLLTGQFGKELTGMFALVGVFIPAVVGIWFGLQRLANLGMSRWWFLGNLVPILNIWIGYRCFACPAGYAYHKKLDGAGIFLAIIYGLVLIAAILFVVAVVGLLMGSIGDPELQETVREALRKAIPQTQAP